MAKTLGLDQIRFEDSFIKEHDDLLPDGFVWVYNIIEHGIIKEDRNEYPYKCFLFDKNDNFILNYNEHTETVWLNIKIWTYFQGVFKASDSQINIFCKSIIKNRFKYKFDCILWEPIKYCNMWEQSFKTK